MFSRASLLTLTVSALVALANPANAQRQGPPEDPEFSGPPAKFWVENLPESENLLPAPPPVRVEAFAREEAAAAAAASSQPWKALGPFPIPNGQTSNRVDPVSGRSTAIAINPTNANVVYVGTAQGGLYRSLDGGASWRQLMDVAPATNFGAPTAIGSLTLNPQNPSTLFVGTGEGNLSGDSFFGSGFYIITNADTANPIVNGPYNARSSDGADIFTGRSIVAIAVDPANANNIFVSTSSGIGGIISSAFSVLPPRGLYRCTNALAGVNGTGTPTWTRLQITDTTSGNTISTSVVMDPSNGNNILVAYYGQAAGDPTSIYRSTNALTATPTFTVSKTNPTFTNAKLAINKVGDTVTVYATTSEADPNGNQGRLFKSTDGGATFGSPLTGVDGFAGGQGFYDIAVGLDPTNANNVSVGGQAGDRIYLYSRNGGATFTPSVTGLHADVHFIAYAPSNPSVIYHANDGGIWRSLDAGLNWTSLNNGTFSATQFSGIALHPTDRNFTIGGTQDNGTIQIRPDGSIFRVDFGDGGYTLIDQNATDTENVTEYHTYFNQRNNLIGTARVLKNSCATEGNWSFHGIYGGLVDPFVSCDGTTDTFNGILLTDNVNFYAPMVLGPGNPNTWYFGTDKLYRSTNRADTAPAVSQLLDQTAAGTPPTGTPVSAIAISPQDDNVRIVGLNNGKIFATTTGSPVLLQIAGAGATNGPTNIPAAPVGRIAIDPNNKNVAYFAFGGFGTPSAPRAHVYKVTNLNQLGQTPAGTVTFTAMSAGLPDIPANALAIDSQTGSATANSTDIYVGTDNGVYNSADGGATWSVYGTGFPHVTVFGLEIQKPARLIRAATHGRGFYENQTLAAVTPQLVNVVSRMTHGSAGAFDINLPLTGGSGIEPRRPTPDGAYTLVFNFNGPVTSGGTATVTSGNGTVSSTTASGNSVIVTLSGVTDVQRLRVQLSGVTVSNSTALAAVSVTLGVLIGDVDSSGTVDSTDVAAVKAQSSSVTPDNSNFRDDVNVNGTINSTDAALTKSKVGHTLPSNNQ